MREGSEQPFKLRRRLDSSGGGGWGGHVGLLSSHGLGSHVLASHMVGSHVLSSRSRDGWWCSGAGFSRDGRIRSLLGVVVMPGLVDSSPSVSPHEEEFNDEVAQNEEARCGYR